MQRRYARIAEVPDHIPRIMISATQLAFSLEFDLYLPDKPIRPSPHTTRLALREPAKVPTARNWADGTEAHAVRPVKWPSAQDHQGRRHLRLCRGHIVPTVAVGTKVGRWRGRLCRPPPAVGSLAGSRSVAHSTVCVAVVSLWYFIVTRPFFCENIVTRPGSM
jgi:hypothetical protein